MKVEKHPKCEHYSGCNESAKYRYRNKYFGDTVVMCEKHRLNQKQLKHWEEEEI